MGRKPTENKSLLSIHTALPGSCDQLSGMLALLKSFTQNKRILDKQENNMECKALMLLLPSYNSKFHLAAHCKRTPVPAKIQRTASAGTEPSLSSLDGALEKKCPDIQ